MKKLINAPERVVADTLRAFAEVHGELVRADLEQHPLPAPRTAAERTRRGDLRRRLRP